jgi:epoxyqueuosine reductase
MGVRMPCPGVSLSAQDLRGRAHAAGFDLVGFAQAEPIPPAVLRDWLGAGHHADMSWLAERAAERLDVTTLFRGARTVMALACNYWHTDEPSPIARYARGRDYHATLKDRLRLLRRSVRERYPGVRMYTAVDTNPVMEKVWAVRAGLGTVTNNGCFTTPEFGSWVVLCTMILDVDVDACAAPVDVDPCGRCRICLDACPTSAILPNKVVDARACLSYQTIENEGEVPEAVRPAFVDTVFGCDICQAVCPLNMTPVKAGPRFEPRPVGTQTVRQLAALNQTEFAALIPGTPMARAGFDGLRRNAALALGAARDEDARPILERLASDPHREVQAAARWALSRLQRRPDAF